MDDRTQDTLGAAASHYARGGHPVFPLWPGTKIPRVKRGFLAASTDLETVAAHWHKHPRDNIGLRPAERQSVLDVDTRYDGHASLADRVIQLGPLPQNAPVARTPTRGLHIWLLHELDGELAGSIGPGIDVKGHNGYLVVPPSVIEVRVDWDHKLLLPRGKHHYTWRVPLPGVTL
jgi:hypothetical protein